jgi:hypothetical protein
MRMWIYKLNMNKWMKLIDLYYICKKKLNSLWTHVYIFFTYLFVPYIFYLNFQMILIIYQLLLQLTFSYMKNKFQSIVIWFQPKQ